MLIWHEVNQEDVASADTYTEMHNRLSILDDFGVAGASVALAQNIMGNDGIAEGSLEEARAQMHLLGLKSGETLPDDHPVWQQGDILIPMLVGIHPVVCLKQIQMAMLGWGFASQQDYRDYIAEHDLEAALTPFSHARNNAVFTLAFLRQPQTVLDEGFENYSQYSYSVLTEARGEKLRSTLNDTNERIRSVLYTDMSFEEASWTLLGEIS